MTCWEWAEEAVRVHEQRNWSARVFSPVDQAREYCERQALAAREIGLQVRRDRKGALFAFSVRFPGGAVEAGPWLKCEKSALYHALKLTDGGRR